MHCLVCTERMGTVRQTLVDQQIAVVIQLSAKALPFNTARTFS